MNVRVRDATVDDSEALAAIQVDNYRIAYAGLLPQEYLDRFSYEEQADDWRTLLAAPQGDLLCVAEIEAGQIVGYGLGRPGPTEIVPYDSELVALHVRRAHQQLGVGRLLIATLARRLRQADCASLMLWTLAGNPARTIYKRLGGQLIGQKATLLGEGDVQASEVAYGWLEIDDLCSE